MLHKYDSVSRNQFPGYTLESDKLDKLDGWSRTGIFIRNNIHYKRRPNLERSGISTVWIQAGLPGKKHFLVHAVYRQFRRLGRKETLTLANQKDRWNQIVDIWAEANLEAREVITLGDVNLDSLVWDTPVERQPQYDKVRHPMYERLRDKILQVGTSKINQEYTRIDSPPHGRMSCLDHIYYTNPEKVNSIKTIHSTFSDHSMVEMNIKVKKIKTTNKFIKIRSFKDYSIQTFQENIRNHPLYVSTIYEMDTQTITQNLISILQESLAEIAPVKRIQLSSKNTQPLSTTAKEALVERDLAHKESKDDPTPEKVRYYRHLRNSTNSLIHKERIAAKKGKFQELSSNRKKWKLTSNELGQNTQQSPTLIREGLVVHTKPTNIANSMNRQYLSTVRDTIRNIPRTQTNPLHLYKTALGPIEHKLHIQELNMNDFQKILSTLSPTTSCTQDFISMKVIKDSSTVLSSHYLHLINRVINSEHFPPELKVTKIIPIPKDQKDPTTISGWRPINIVPSLSKLIEKALLIQVMTYLKRHQLIHHTHHGSVQGKNTQTLIQELYQSLLQSLEAGEDSVFIQLDQSKAYDVIDHQILFGKMKHLGFNTKTLNIFKSYMGERKQYVEVDSFISNTLIVGPRSVTQGSILSCVSYLIYILDITQVYHSVRHNPVEYIKCKQTNAKSFVDDNLLHTRLQPGQTFHQAVTQTLAMIQDYTDANLLALNPEKSKVMLITNKTEEKENFTITVRDKTLTHQKYLTVLGNVIADDLSWDKHVQTKVIPALANRARALKLSTNFMDMNFRKIYATSIFKGKLTYAIDAWGGVGEALLTKVQNIQDRVVKAALGFKGEKLSNLQRQQLMGWVSVRQEVIIATMRLTHKVVHYGVPEELAATMDLNVRNHRLRIAHKLDTKPKVLNKNKRMRSSFKSRAYYFNTLPHRLTEIEESKCFNRWLKVHLKDPSNLPKIIPTKEEPKRAPNQTCTGAQQPKLTGAPDPTRNLALGRPR